MENGGWLARAVWVALVAVIVTGPTQHSIVVGSQLHVSLVDPLVWGAAGLCLLQGWRMGNWRTWRLPPWPALVYLGVAILATLACDSRGRAAKDVFQITEYLVLAVALFLNLLGLPSRRRQAVLLFLGAGSVVVVVALLQYAAGSTPGNAMQVRGSFGNRNVYGGYLALLLPFTFGLLVTLRDWRWRLWLLLLLGAGGITLLAGGSFLGIVLALLLMAALADGRWLAVTAAGLLVAVTVILPHLPGHNAEILFDSIRPFNDDGAPARRYPEWQAAAALTAEHPLFGVGPGAYQANVGTCFGTLPAEAVKAEADSQNLYLVIAATMGLPGVVAFVVLLGWCMAGAARAACRLPRGLDRGLALGALGALVAFAVSSIWAPLFVRGIGIPLAFVMALALFSYPGLPDGAADEGTAGHSGERTHD